MAGEKPAIIVIIALIMMSIGAFLPYITAEFSGTATTTNYDTISGEVSSIDQDTSLGDVLVSLGKMFFWYYASLPFWLNLILIMLKIIFWVMLAIEVTPLIG